MRKHLLPLTFTIFTYCGLWRPIKFDYITSMWHRYAYNTFTASITAIMYTFTFCGLIDILFEVKNVEELINNLFMLLSMLNVCCKLTTVLVCRKDILAIIKILSIGLCKPRDTMETAIQDHFDHTIKLTTISYMILTECTVSLVAVKALFDLKKATVLPFRIWLPYDYTSSSLLFCLTYIHQMVALVTGSLVQVATESLVSGLMMQICAQLKILKYRLSQVPQSTLAYTREKHSTLVSQQQTRSRLTECICHHKRIFELAETVNRVFECVFFIQFTVSSLVLCCSVYLLASDNFGSIQFMSLSFYVTCMLVQLFLFCWYGNEVILKSLEISDAAYEMDWTSLDIKEKKILLSIMVRCTTPVKFNSAFLVTLSIDSYTSILKLSYSAYNVLQRSSE